MSETPTTYRSLPLTDLSEEEQMFREQVRQFAESEVRPLVHAMDSESKIPRELIDKCFALGIMGVEIPEKLQGAGATFFMSALVVEELARVDASVAVLVDVQNTLVNNALLRWGSDELMARYFPKLATQWVGAYALSEAGSGSDAFALACRADDKGDYYELTGRKLWITNAAEAELFIVLATVDPSKGYKGITAFLVERSFPGFSVGKKEDKLGIRASSTCELILEGCRVPKKNVLGEVGKGYKIAIETLNEGRIGIGAQMVGLAQGAYELALRSGREYRAGDRIAYYVTGQRKNVPVHGSAKLVSEWNPGDRDENVAYYLAKLEALYAKFGPGQAELALGLPDEGAPAGEEEE